MVQRRHRRPDATRSPIDRLTVPQEAWQLIEEAGVSPARRNLVLVAADLMLRARPATARNASSKLTGAITASAVLDRLLGPCVATEEFERVAVEWCEREMPRRRWWCRVCKGRGVINGHLCQACRVSLQDGRAVVTEYRPELAEARLLRQRRWSLLAQAASLIARENR